MHSIGFDKAVGNVTVVLRSATHSLAVVAHRRRFVNVADSDADSGRGSRSAERVASPLLAKLWGPTTSGFVQFIDEILDAEVSLELRKVSDGTLIYAASGSNGGLELML